MSVPIILVTRKKVLSVKWNVRHWKIVTPAHVTSTTQMKDDIAQLYKYNVYIWGNSRWQQETSWKRSVDIILLLDLCLCVGVILYLVCLVLWCCSEFGLWYIMMSHKSSCCIGRGHILNSLWWYMTPETVCSNNLEHWAQFSLDWILTKTTTLI